MPFNWLLQAATKLQNSLYRNAEFKYKKIIRGLKNEIAEIPSLQEEIKRLQNEMKEKDKLIYDLNAEIETLTINIEELNDDAKTSTKPNIVETNVSKKSDVEIKEKEKLKEINEAVVKKRKKEFDMEEYSRKVDDEMSNIIVSKKKKGIEARK